MRKSPTRKTLTLAFAALVIAFVANPRGRLLPMTTATAAESRIAVENVHPAAPDDVRRLELLTYNVFVRPEPVSFGDETTCRAQRIGERLASEGLDVAVLTETFLREDVELLAHYAAPALPHRIVSQPRGDGMLGVSGGLSLFSKHPVVEWEAIGFDDCSGFFSDCLATKGVLWALLDIGGGERVNVVATHLDAGRGDDDVAARASQLAQLRDYLADRLDQKWPTVLMGDFNVNGAQPDDAVEYREMLERLTDLAEGRVVHDTVRVSMGRAAPEQLGTAAFTTLQCRTSIWCNRALESRHRLDYVFAFDGRDQTAHVVDAGHDPVSDQSCGSLWLSDHKAVRATVDFADRP